jgi:polar amino acid transport system substrate-binding protein
MIKTPRLASAPLLALTVAALAFAGCGSSNSSSSGSGGSGTQSSSGGGSSTQADKHVVSLVPNKYHSKGTLIIAADATYAPNEFIGPDGHTVVGMDADLGNAIAQTMGLKASIKNATFDSILPGLASGKYDLGMSSFTDTKEREKTVDFVTYFSAGTSFYVKAQGGPNITSLDDLCGHKVAVEKGTTQQIDVEHQITKCKSAGKPAPQLTVFPDQNGANLALSSGRADVGMADSPVAAYQVKKSGGQFKLSGSPYGTAPYGIAIPKNSGLDKPVLEAMRVLIKNGKYQTILKKWGIQSGAISTPGINQATS